MPNFTNADISVTEKGKKPFNTYLGKTYIHSNRSTSPWNDPVYIEKRKKLEIRRELLKKAVSKNVTSIDEDADLQLPTPSTLSKKNIPIDERVLESCNKHIDNLRKIKNLTAVRMQSFLTRSPSKTQRTSALVETKLPFRTTFNRNSGWNARQQ